jgi:type II secretory pathway predicted ATPase ExeA
MLLQLNRWLIERFRMEETCVVVVDEAQNLSWDLLEEIRLLTNLETSSEKLLQIVLSGQPELEEKLHHPSVRQLRQRVSLWCRTQALTESQTHAYVTERLRIAGASWQLFSDEALDLVHRFSRGIPRIINLLCEHSLILAYVEQVQQVNATIVESVATELELEVQPFMLSSAALGNGKPLSPRSETEDNFIAAFNRESPGRQGR